QPADVLSASDRFAAQVKPPGGERVAERRTHRERRCDRGRERAARDGEITGALEHEKRHRQRSADDRGAKRPHADEHAGGGVEPEPGKERIDFDREKLAEQRPDEKRGEEQPAAEPGGERYHAREKLQRNEKGEFRRGDRKSTRLNSSHRCISYAVFCLKKKTNPSNPSYFQTKKKANKIKTQNQ